MVYQWKIASRIKVDPQIVGEICENLEHTIGLNAKNLVKVSEPIDSPLHNEFEWNDNEAANLYRENQARHIINCLCVKTETPGITPIKAYFKVEPNTSNYDNINLILSNEDKYTKLLNQAIQELKWFKQKYEKLIDLKSIFDQIEELVNKQS